MKRRVAGQVIAILVGTGALAGFVTSQFLPREYISRATVRFNNRVESAGLNEAAAETLSTPSLSRIVSESVYYKPELDFTPVDDVVERIRKNSSITGIGDGFHVEFTDPDRYAALEIARILIEETAKNAHSSTRIVEPIHAGPAGPGAALCVLAGSGAGLLIGLAIAAIAGVLTR